MWSKRPPLVAAIVGVACSGPPAPRPIANTAAPLPAAAVTCFAGSYVDGGREPVAIVMRRTVDPGAGTIRQEGVRSSGSTYVLRGQVDLTVAGNTFRSVTPDDARGEGRFDGPAWAWTHWTETRLRGEGPPTVTEEIEGWLDAKYLRFRGRFQESAHTWSAELEVLDCADYEARVDQMVPIKEPIDP